MKRRTIVSVLALALAICVPTLAKDIAELPNVVSATYDVGSQDGFGWADRLLGQKIAGTWFGSFDIPGVLSGTFIQTYDSEGTYQMSSTNRLSSLQHGTWNRTGYREITQRVLHYSFDPAGNLAAISRSWNVQRFDRDYQAYEGELTIEVCPCVPGSADPYAPPDCSPLLEALLADPNDSEVCFNPPLPPGTIQGKRLRVNAP